jgi:chloramphenicol 3-O phosphotransferase
MERGRIILLNGVSSSGKSTLAKALVKRMPGYFHLSLDDFDLVIERMEDREHERLIPVETEYFFHRTIAMFSDRGVNLIVDHVLHDRFTKHDCLAVLRGYPVLLVGVHCPPDELDRRERQRGDRPVGQGRQQLAYTHADLTYAVEVDTLLDSPERCAERIIEALRAASPDAEVAREVGSHE